MLVSSILCISPTLLNRFSLVAMSLADFEHFKHDIFSVTQLIRYGYRIAMDQYGTGTGLGRQFGTSTTYLLESHTANEVKLVTVH